jgi:hypothetical protein
MIPNTYGTAGWYKPIAGLGGLQKKTNSYFFFLKKGPAAEATDAPQP